MNAFNGGYGDDSALEDYLRDHDALLRWKADGDPDLAQEARIEAWRTLQKKPGATRSYVDQAASWRIDKVRQGYPPTGHLPTTGKVARDPLTPERGSRKAATVADITLFDSLEFSEALERADWAYHSGEIGRAIDELPPKQKAYVLLRFYAGLEPVEIAAYLHDGELWRIWRAAKATLTESLAHLVSA